MTTPPASGQNPNRSLVAVKVVHTVAWALFVGAIVGVPLSSAAGHYRRALVFAGIVFVEVLVLLVNSWKCPLTAVAARYTPDRRANFDIYLPEWLARHNKGIFGTLYGLGLLFTLVRWMGWLG